MLIISKTNNTPLKTQQNTSKCIKEKETRTMWHKHLACLDHFVLQSMTINFNRKLKNIFLKCLKKFNKKWNMIIIGYKQSYHLALNAAI